MPDREAPDRPCSAEGERAGGTPTPSAVEADGGPRRARRRREAEDRRDESHREGLERDRPEHLARVTRRSPAAARLPRALGDDDREGVVDAERRHEQRDAGEHEQERLEEVEEVGADDLACLLREVGAGDRLDTVREHRPDVVDELVLAHAGVGRDVDPRDLGSSGMNSSCASSSVNPRTSAARGCLRRRT